MTALIVVSCTGSDSGQPADPTPDSEAVVTSSTTETSEGGSAVVSAGYCSSVATLYEQAAPLVLDDPSDWNAVSSMLEALEGADAAVSSFSAAVNEHPETHWSGLFSATRDKDETSEVGRSLEALLSDCVVIAGELQDFLGAVGASGPTHTSSGAIEIQFDNVWAGQETIGCKTLKGTSDDLGFTEGNLFFACPDSYTVIDIATLLPIVNLPSTSLAAESALSGREASVGQQTMHRGTYLFVPFLEHIPAEGLTPDSWVWTVGVMDLNEPFRFAREVVVGDRPDSTSWEFNVIGASRNGSFAVEAGTSVAGHTVTIVGSQGETLATYDAGGLLGPINGFSTGGIFVDEGTIWDLNSERILFSAPDAYVFLVGHPEIAPYAFGTSGTFFYDGTRAEFDAYSLLGINRITEEVDEFTALSDGIFVNDLVGLFGGKTPARFLRVGTGEIGWELDPNLAVDGYSLAGRLVVDNGTQLLRVRTSDGSVEAEISPAEMVAVERSGLAVQISAGLYEPRLGDSPRRVVVNIVGDPPDATSSTTTQPDSAATSTTQPEAVDSGAASGTDDPDGVYRDIQSTAAALGYAAAATLYYSPSDGPNDLGCDNAEGVATMPAPIYYNAWSIPAGPTPGGFTVHVYASSAEAEVGAAELTKWYSLCTDMVGNAFVVRDPLSIEGANANAWVSTATLGDAVYPSANAVVLQGLVVWDLWAETEAGLLNQLSRLGIAP